MAGYQQTLIIGNVGRDPRVLPLLERFHVFFIFFMESYLKVEKGELKCGR